MLKRGGQIKHGGSKTPEYKAWADMIQRCHNPKNKRFNKYGGRNIKVCDRWKNPSLFLLDMGRKPSSKYSLDRIDNNGNYTPSNCRWATRSMQQRNKGPMDTSNLIRGDKHWTRINKEKAIQIARKNISHAHGSLEHNPNAKLSIAGVIEMRTIHKFFPNIRMKTLGGMFGVGRETARKVVKGISW